jgi:DNA-binding transcriptional ArsR family regulator
MTEPLAVPPTSGSPLGTGAGAGATAGFDGDDRHPPADRLRLATVLAALADPARLAIVRTLDAAAASPCHELHHAAGLRISRSTFSHHQRILREAGIIRERIHGAQRILSLRRAELDASFPGLLDLVVTTPRSRLVDA